MPEPREETTSVEGSLPLGAYVYKAPRLYAELVEGFRQKKILGALCTGCGRVYVPMRNICPRCWMRISERTQVSEKGTVTSYTITPELKRGRVKVMGVDPVEAGWVSEGERLILVYVRFDGADSNYPTLMLNLRPEDVRIGMRVRAVWAGEPKGKLSDLEGVEPIG